MAAFYNFLLEGPRSAWEDERLMLAALSVHIFSVFLYW